MSGFPTLMLFEAGKPVGAKTGLIDMQTASEVRWSVAREIGLARRTKQGFGYCFNERSGGKC